MMRDHGNDITGDEARGRKHSRVLG